VFSAEPIFVANLAVVRGWHYKIKRAD